MNIECPNCKKTGQVDDAKIPEPGVHAVCPQCNEKFLVKLDKPKDFEFEAVAEPTSKNSENNINSNNLSTYQSHSNAVGKRYLGVLPSVLISAILAFIVSIAFFVLFSILTNSKLHTTTHGIIFICCLLISYQLLRERTFPTITILSIAGGYIFFYIIVSIVIHTSNKPKTNLVYTPKQQAQANQSVQTPLVQKPMSSAAPPTLSYAVDEATKAKLHKAALIIYRQYPFLDGDNEISNSTAMSEVSQTCADLVKRGRELPDALRIAAAQVGPKYGPSDEKKRTKEIYGLTPLGNIPIDEFCIHLSTPIPQYKPSK